MVLGINPEGANKKESDFASHANCKQLDYEDYANYLIVMSGDILGKGSVLHILFISQLSSFCISVYGREFSETMSATISSQINDMIG